MRECGWTPCWSIRPLCSFRVPLLTLGLGLASSVERENAALGDAAYWELSGGVSDTPTSLASAGPRAWPLSGTEGIEGVAPRPRPSAQDHFSFLLNPLVENLWVVGFSWATRMLSRYLWWPWARPRLGCPVLPATEQDASLTSHLRDGMRPALNCAVIDLVPDRRPGSSCWPCPPRLSAREGLSGNSVRKSGFLEALRGH